MTVTAKNTRVQYTGNGLVATYAYDWKILDQADLVVITTDLLGADTTLVLGVGYTVTGAGNDSGGNVVLTNSLATGQLLTVYVDMDIDQPTDLTNQQSPFLERIESALDRQALVSQQLAEKLGRCIQLKPTSTDSSGDLQELLESVGTNATVAAASAAAATTQAGLANTARIAAEAAVASIPTTFGAFGLTLAETTTASNARAALELGSAATLTAGTAANNAVQLTADGKLPAVSGALLTGITASQISGLSSAIAGASRNLAMSATGLSALVSMTADELIVKDATGNAKLLSGLALSASTAVVGAGGLDTGAIAGSTWYAVWAIAKTDGGTALLFSLSSTAPTMPSGYTHKARVGWIRTDSTANKYPLSFKQSGRRVQWVTTSGGNLTKPPLISSGTMGSFSTSAYIPVSVAVRGAALYAPFTASEVDIYLSTGGTSLNMGASPNPNYGGWGVSNCPPLENSAANNGTAFSVKGRLVLESDNVYWASTGVAYLLLLGWEDNL